MALVMIASATSTSEGQGYVKVRFIEYHSKNSAKHFWRRPMNQSQHITLLEVLAAIPGRSCLP